MGGLKDLFGGGGGALLPLATSLFLPGVGDTVGHAVGDTLGLDLGATGTQALGNALVGGGLGALTGGGKGALTGALIGGITPFAAGALGLGGGIAGSLPTESQGGFGPDMPKDFKAPEGSGSGGLGSLLGGGSGGGALKVALPLMLMAGLASNGRSSGQGDKPQVTPEQQEAMDSQGKPLSKVSWVRPRPVMPQGDLTRYGYGPEHVFYKDNRVPQYNRGGAIDCYADGGDVEGGLALTGAGALHPMEPAGESRYFVGPGAGRDDAIDAKVSNNEYVFDAEVVSLLGDGSPDAGAAALDEMRKNIRRHKGGALAVGEISPPALRPEEYLPRGVL